MARRPLAHLMRLHGLAHLAVEVVPHQPYELGPFVVRFVPSRHSKLLVRSQGADGWTTDVRAPSWPGLAPSAYKCGAVYGIRMHDIWRCFHLSPGKCRPQRQRAARWTGRHLLGGRCRAQRDPSLLGAHPAAAVPQVVVPSHYDNFFSPLGQPQDFVRRVDLADVPRGPSRRGGRAGCGPAARQYLPVARPTPSQPRAIGVNGLPMGTVGHENRFMPPGRAPCSGAEDAGIPLGER